MKAERIELSVSRLNRKDDWELIIEGIYGAAQHYISYICAARLNEHKETHKGLIRFLKENKLNELANKFHRLDELRIGKWYENQINGETVDLGFEVLNEITKIRLSNVRPISTLKGGVLRTHD